MKVNPSSQHLLWRSTAEVAVRETTCGFKLHCPRPAASSGGIGLQDMALNFENQKDVDLPQQCVGQCR